MFTGTKLLLTKLIFPNSSVSNPENIIFVNKNKMLFIANLNEVYSIYNDTFFGYIVTFKLGIYKNASTNISSSTLISFKERDPILLVGDNGISYTIYSKQSNVFRKGSDLFVSYVLHPDNPISPFDRIFPNVTTPITNLMFITNALNIYQIDLLKAVYFKSYAFGNILICPMEPVLISNKKESFVVLSNITMTHRLSLLEYNLNGAEFRFDIQQPNVLVPNLKSNFELFFTLKNHPHFVSKSGYNKKR